MIKCSIILVEGSRFRQVPPLTPGDILYTQEDLHIELRQ